MSAPAVLSRPMMRAVAVGAVIAGTALVGVPVGANSGVSGVSGVPAASATCPAPLPLPALHRGMTAYGLTTDRGTTPHRFAVRVLGVLRDGIAPGIDMILVRANSPAIRAAGGIWAGMSGSPVYAADGRLIGAVSYGLAYGPSPTAGLTPAGAIYNLRNFTGAGASYASHAALTPALQRAVTATGDVSAVAAASGMSTLPTPVAVSGVGSRQVAWLQRQQTSAPMRLFPGGAASHAAAPAGAIRPGGPLAVSVSYGAFSYAGIGTATAVCGREVFGWGHPMMAFGRTTEAAHAARIAYIEKETLGAPFVVGNVGGVVGTVTQDRLGGLRARLGKPAPAARIRVHVRAGARVHRTGVTWAPVATWMPSALANAAYGELWSTLQMDGVGSAWLSWRVVGHRAHGKRWTYARTDRTDSQYGIGYSVGDMLYYPMSTIMENPFEKVGVDKVSVRVRASQDFREYTLTALKVLVGKRYVEVTPTTTLDVTPGQVLALRATLTPYQQVSGVKHVELALRVPNSMGPGSTATVTVTGGAGGGDVGVEAGGGGAVATTPMSFDDVLKQLRATPRNDRVYAELDIPDAEGNPMPIDKDKAAVDRVVRGAITVSVQVPGGEEPPPVG